MDTNTQTIKDDFTDLLVEIAPDSMELGQDADGMPKTVPAEAKAEPVAKETAKAPVIPKAKYSDAEYEATQQALQEAREQAELLTRDRDQERASRTKAEQDAHKLHYAAVNAHAQKVQAELDHVTDSLNHWETTAQVANRNLSLAHEAQNPEEIAKWTSAIAKAEMSIATLKNAIPGLENEHRLAARDVEIAARTPKPEAKREEPAPKQQTPDDWIANQRKTVGGKFADWLNDNREFVTNKKMHEKFLAFANNFQVVEEMPLNSEQFIEALNAKFLGKGKPKAEAEAVNDENETHEEEQEAAAAPAKRTTVAAPVSRGKPAQSSASANRITLTREQFGIAPDLYPSYNDLSPETRAKFPAWSENAARYQYDQDLKRAKADGKFNRG
jgi:hypothetical protein